MKKLYLLFFIFCVIRSEAAELFVEAESFSNKGGWVVDQQFENVMGSPYLMAHGLGIPVKDATTVVSFPKSGTYHVYVRTYNWTSPWTQKEGPGRFLLRVGESFVSVPLGITGTYWEWQDAGMVTISDKQTKIVLRDLTGFNGRCDAVYFTTNMNQRPPSDIKELTAFRKQKLGFPKNPRKAGMYDFVVVGGGVAGICAAVSAARLGMKVALINDRPVLGGNNSSEIRVHLGGKIGVEPYTQLGNMIKEFGPERMGNAKPKEYYEDEKKEQFVKAEENVTLFSCFRAIKVIMKGNKIRKVIAKHIENGEEVEFESPLFSDCTGDGTIGYLAGADFLMGRECKDDYKEPSAPDIPDKMTMGASVQWYSEEKESLSVFPNFSYGLDFNDNSAEKVLMGEWTWETGMNRDQIQDFEYIRDYGLMVVYSNWSYLKNKYKEDDRYLNRHLKWVAYIAGKRESRRLLGDHILTENDIHGQVKYDDASVPTTWSIDLHYPDPENSKYFPGEEFKSIAHQEIITPYPIPYRCLYSRNIPNLFMAGRNISVTHIALGSVRVMRTTGMMGEVVGMAASLCKKYSVFPCDIYKNYLFDLKLLMEDGTGKKDIPNNQQYNEG